MAMQQEAMKIGGTFHTCVAYFQGLCKGISRYPHKIWPYIVQYLHFKILEFPLDMWMLNMSMAIVGQGHFICSWIGLIVRHMSVYNKIGMQR